MPVTSGSPLVTFTQDCPGLSALGVCDMFKMQGLPTNQPISTSFPSVGSGFAIQSETISPSFDVGVHYGALADRDWIARLSPLCGKTAEELTARAEEIVGWVERMEASINRRRKEDGRQKIRVAERYQYHWVARDVPAEVAAVLRTEPDRLPTVRIGRKDMPAIRVLPRSRRRHLDGELAPHVSGIPVAGQEQTAAKERQATHGLKKLCKFHGIKMP